MIIILIICRNRNGDQMKEVLIGSLWVLLLAGSCGCEGRTSRAGIAPQAEQIVRQGTSISIPAQSPLRQSLKLYVAQTRELRPHFVAPASVEADPARFVHIFPPLSGRVSKLHVRLGESVRQGQLLLTLDSPDFSCAQSDFIKAKSAAELAERSLHRQQDLYEHHIAAKRELEQAESDWSVARSELERAESRLRSLAVNPGAMRFGEPLAIYSPIDGQVIDLTVGQGEFRGDSTAPLMTVADLSTVWLSADVQEKDLPNALKGQPVDAVLSAYPEERFLGTVLFVGNVVDPVTRTAKVRVAFQNLGGRLKPGMFGKVSFSEPVSEALLVPTSAIFLQGEKPMVLVEVKPWRFEPRAVTLGSEQDGFTAIRSGLKTGTAIMARDGILLE